MVLILYRLAAEVFLWIARAGRPLWPARWRVAERLVPSNSSTPRFPLREDRGVIWLHAASLGECKGLWALARELRALDADFVLTANTEAGLEFLRAAITKHAESSRWHAAIAPFDHPRVARKFLAAHRARALMAFEMEAWPHWFLAARRAGVPVFRVSARWNARARRRYGLFPAAARRVLRGVAWTQAQSDRDADALRRAGCANVEVGGDLRGLQYLAEAEATVPERPWAERRGAAFVSFHARELPHLVPMIREAREENPLIVFPRKPREFPAFLAALAPLGFVAHSTDPRAARRVVDRFGLVGETLHDVRIAVVGGSFGDGGRIGGHNLWEPLLAGCRAAIGPHHENQAWLAERMRAAGLLNVIDEATDWRAMLAGEAPATGEEGAREEIRKARAALAEAVERVRERLAVALAARENA
jgi:3-deoxy-D-manno-octulosonic-acid transferase